jgi:hypothetical protein
MRSALVRLEVLKVVTRKLTVFWIVTPKKFIRLYQYLKR